MDRAKILVVEDDPGIWDLLGEQLRVAGFRTVFAFDGISAIKVAREERPDLIVLDIGLPGGDGFVIMERLAAFPALCRIPVIVLSARAHEPNPSRALELGAAAFVSKPYKREELVKLINAALHRVPVPEPAVTAP
jgi:two-component system alkaline phosphatase synthesis response regulator PhoP